MTRIGSWNIEGRLGHYRREGRGSPEHIIEGIRELDADVLFLPEAYTEVFPIEEKTVQALHILGYDIKDVPYEDTDHFDNRFLDPHMLLLSRIAIQSFEIFRLGGIRNALSATLRDVSSETTFRFIGIHLDDKSEAIRQSQLPDLIDHINNPKYYGSLDTVMAGDYNSMHGSTLRAKVVRSLPVRRATAHLLPSEDLRSFATRASDMGIGSILSSIESETNLRDVDPKHTPTATPKVRDHEWIPSVPLLDIDHMMKSDAVVSSDFGVGKKDMGSDHRPVSVTISFDT